MLQQLEEGRKRKVVVSTPPAKKRKVEVFSSEEEEDTEEDSDYADSSEGDSEADSEGSDSSGSGDSEEDEGYGDDSEEDGDGSVDSEENQIHTIFTSGRPVIAPHYIMVTEQIPNSKMAVKQLRHELLANHYTEKQLRDLAGGAEIQHKLLKSIKTLHQRLAGHFVDELPTEV